MILLEKKKQRTYVILYIVESIMTALYETLEFFVSLYAIKILNIQAVKRERTDALKLYTGGGCC